MDPMTNFRPNRPRYGRSSLRNKDVRSNGRYWFDASCFQTPAPNYFGDSGTNIITGPGINNWDIGVAKVISGTRIRHLAVPYGTVQRLQPRAISEPGQQHDGHKLRPHHDCSPRQGTATRFEDALVGTPKAHPVLVFFVMSFHNVPDFRWRIATILLILVKGVVN